MGFLSRSLSGHLIPAYGFGVVQLPHNPTVVFLYKVELRLSLRSDGIRIDSDRR